MSSKALLTQAASNRQKRQQKPGPEPTNDLELAVNTLRYEVKNAKRSADRRAAAIALAELSKTTLEGIISLAIVAGIRPSELLEHLTERMRGLVDG